MKINNVLKRIVIDEETGIGITNIIKTSSYSMHIALVNSGSKLRAHYHRDRDEIYIVLKGYGRLRLGDEYYEVSKDHVAFIPKKTIHGIENIGQEPLIFVFISIPPFDPVHDRIFIE